MEMFTKLLAAAVDLTTDPEYAHEEYLRGMAELIAAVTPNGDAEGTRDAVLALIYARIGER